MKDTNKMTNVKNNNLSPEPPNADSPDWHTWWNKTFRKSYHNYLKSKWGVLTALVILTIFVFIPCYHELTAKIPPNDELNKTSGMIFFKNIKKYDSGVSLKTPEDTIFLNCKGIYAGDNYCIKYEKRADLEGKQGTALWYKQRIYLWLHHNRLVELRVKDKEIVSRAETQRRFESAVTSVAWMLPITILLCIGITLVNIILSGRDE